MFHDVSLRLHDFVSMVKDSSTSVMDCSMMFNDITQFLSDASMIVGCCCWPNIKLNYAACIPWPPNLPLPLYASWTKDTLLFFPAMYSVGDVRRVPRNGYSGTTQERGTKVATKCIVDKELCKKVQLSGVMPKYPWVGNHLEHAEDYTKKEKHMCPPISELLCDQDHNCCLWGAQTAIGRLYKQTHMYVKDVVDHEQGV